MAQPFYLPLNGQDDTEWEHVQPTSSTVSVWSSSMQHGSPPAALLVRALEQCEPRDDARLSRVSVEILGPIPLTECRVRAYVTRPGTKVELLRAELEAQLDDGTFRPVATAQAWRLATADTSDSTIVHDESMRHRDTGRDADPAKFFPPGYVHMVEWVLLNKPGGTGPGQFWGRPLVPLVGTEPITPLQRLFAVVDSANGLGAKLDIRKWTYLNTDLTVHLHRQPTGDWVGVSAESSVGPEGIGMCAATLHDEHGALGRSAQTLLVRRR
ncbi:thioesterase family protein [Lolliginicoccus suaedae]|uniref:thioesterase family protein n=1 Tax=Lolliginicoccus suaedae TaxID=2605429 RepID=UPI0011EE6E70|nr:thioesterase family protein [Lolliginicoccus suaedae]